MATYTYKCKDCEHKQTEKHGMMEEPTIKCEKCGSAHTFIYIDKPPVHGWRDWPGAAG